MTAGADQQLQSWTLLVTAIAGRPVQLARTDQAAAHTDGHTIHLAAGDGLDTALVQAALIAAGSLQRPVIAQLLARRAGRERYLTLEAIRAARLLDGVLPAAFTARVAAVHDGPVSDSALASLDRSGDSSVVAAPSWFGTIRPLLLVRAGGVSAHAVAAPADGRLQEPEPDAGEDVDRSTLLEAMSTPSSSALVAKLARMLGISTTKEPGDGSSGGELQQSSDHAARADPGGHRVPAPGWLRAHAAASGAAPAGRWYPEWDHTAGRYREDWCAVAQFAAPLDPDIPPAAASSHAGLRRSLAQVGLAPQTHRRQADGDTLDLTALIDDQVARRTGSSGDERIHQARRQTGRELSVLVLLDATGSTGESTDGLQTFHAQRRLTDTLLTELDLLGVRTAAHAFHSRGRKDVRFLQLTPFAGRYDQTARRRLATLRPAGFTRLGAVVRHGTHLLATGGGTPRMLLLVIGDGLPYDEGYEDRHAQQDTRRALSEAVARGVGCACLSVRSPTDAQTIEHVWGHVSHRDLGGADDLARHARPLLRWALREAAASHRHSAGPDRSHAFAA